MKPARFRADLLRYSGGEGNDVVFHFGFDCVDAVQVEVTFLPDSYSGRLRYETGFGERFRRGDFDFQPGAELVLVTPDVPHIGTRITCDQRRAPSVKQQQ